MIFDKAPTAPNVRPQFNIGGLMDIPSGSYLPGPRGESILNSGISLTNAVVGPQNSFKTALLVYLFLTVLSRYLGSRMALYDTEGSFSYMRLNKMLKNVDRLRDLAVSQEESDLIQLVDGVKMLGDEYFEIVKEFGKERMKNKKTELKTTPFEGVAGQLMQLMPPIMVLTDSITEFKSSSVEKGIVDKNNIGDAGANTQYMRDANAKTQMIRQLPNLAENAGFLFGNTAHTGRKIEMGGKYDPKDAQLTFSRKGAKVKGAPEKFEFINNNFWEIFYAAPFPNSSSDKSAKYPLSDADRMDGQTDFQKVICVQTRSKGGPSGFRFEFLFSQELGFLPDLTQFHFIKDTCGGYGIEGSAINYNLALKPDVNLSRTKVRGLLKENYLLRRAVEITSEMAQMDQLWRLDPKYKCTPAELYEDIKKLGYDWDTLLNTRGWWCFEEDLDKELPFLSTMDLLKMRAGEYKPYWWPKDNKAA